MIEDLNVSREPSPTTTVATEKEPLPHTPGPWSHLHRCCADGMWRTQVFAIANHAEPLATLQWTPVEIAARQIATNREANARLMAAAPTLLEAAEGVQSLLSLIADGLWIECPYLEAQRRRIAALNAAIAHALGPLNASPKSREEQR
jgi:hypothetical protein